MTIEISFWEQYLKCTEASSITEKESFLCLVKLQLKLVQKLYELIAVEERPITDAALGASASFASTYIKELAVIPLPSVMKKEAIRLARFSVQERTEQLLMFILRKRLDLNNQSLFLLRTIAAPMATVCYSIPRPDVELRGPSGCSSSSQKVRAASHIHNTVKRGCCPACGHPPLVKYNNKYTCSLCLSGWEDDSGCLFCDNKDAVEIENFVVCQSTKQGVPITDAEFPESLFTRFNGSVRRVSYTPAEEWVSILNFK
ncbi:MAG: hypothetical protein HY606_08515 [Planctomycetes bacterium]|nr:hypothetical protein [Planctomycetota bacterium]